LHLKGVHLAIIRIYIQASVMTKELKTKIRRAAEELIASGAKEVYLFGSAAQKRKARPKDIDLAVSGLPPKCFFKAMGRARRTLRQPLDLVDLDEVNPFTAYLKTSGELKCVA
jgi:predicted nucleotidyltransferase